MTAKSPTSPMLYEPEAFQERQSDDVLLVHVAEAANYAAAHIPGARLVEPRELVCGVPPAPGRLPEAQALNALFARLGYRPSQHIVAYDDEGGGWAGRFCWTLDVIGHADWGYLNGGIHAWAASGLPLEQGPDQASAGSPVELSVQAEPVAEAEDVLAAMEAPDQVIWDVRSAEEYAGLRSGSARAGHIPGAVNIDWMHLKDAANHTRLAADLQEQLDAQGITPDKQIITHCQTHHRSGLSYMAARLLGYPHVRAYHGSWSEWGNRDDTPIER